MSEAQSNDDQTKKECSRDQKRAGKINDVLFIIIIIIIIIIINYLVSMIKYFKDKYIHIWIYKHLYFK